MGMLELKGGEGMYLVQEDFVFGDFTNVTHESKELYRFRFTLISALCCLSARQVGPTRWFLGQPAAGPESEQRAPGVRLRGKRNGWWRHGSSESACWRPYPRYQRRWLQFAGIRRSP